MHSKYKVLKFSSNSFDNIEDLVSIEEPLEISLKFKNQDQWVTQNLSITMRTPGHDEDLVRGFLLQHLLVLLWYCYLAFLKVHLLNLKMFFLDIL